MYRTIPKTHRARAVPLMHGHPAQGAEVHFHLNGATGPLQALVGSDPGWTQLGLVTTPNAQQVIYKGDGFLATFGKGCGIDRGGEVYFFNRFPKEYIGWLEDASIWLVSRNRALITHARGRLNVNCQAIQVAPMEEPASGLPFPAVGHFEAFEDQADTIAFHSNGSVTLACPDWAALGRSIDGSRGTPVDSSVLVGSGVFNSLTRRLSPRWYSLLPQSVMLKGADWTALMETSVRGVAHDPRPLMELSRSGCRRVRLAEIPPEWWYGWDCIPPGETGSLNFDSNGVVLQARGGLRLRWPWQDGWGVSSCHFDIDMHRMVRVWRSLGAVDLFLPMANPLLPVGLSDPGERQWAWFSVRS